MFFGHVIEAAVLCLAVIVRSSYLKQRKDDVTWLMVDSSSAASIVIESEIDSHFIHMYLIYIGKYSL